MTDDRLNFIEQYCIPNGNRYFRRLMLELINEVRRARQSERICRSAAMIYQKQSEPVILRRYG